MTEEDYIHPLNKGIKQFLKVTKNCHDLIKSRQGATHEELLKLNHGMKETITAFCGFSSQRKKARSLQEHRLVMACLRYVHKTYYKNNATDNEDGVLFNDFDDFLIYVKVKIGHCVYRYVRDDAGNKFKMAFPKSISFAHADGVEFQSIKNRIERWMLDAFDFGFELYKEGRFLEKMTPLESGR